MPTDRLAAGHRHPHDGLSAADGGVRRRVHLRDAGRPAVASASSSGLDYQDPMFDPHLTFQRFKQHPFVAALLEGGKMVRYGAKALPEGGWHTIPRVLHGRRAHRRRRRRLHELDAAQGHSPRDADRHARGRDGVRRGARGRRVGARRSRRTSDAIDASDVQRELYPVRNVHQAFEHGLLAGVAVCRACRSSTRRLVVQGSDAGARRATSGCETLAELLRRRSRRRPTRPSHPVKIDRQLTFDKVTNVHFSGTRHREDQPSHLHRARHRHLPHEVPRRVRQPVHALLSGQRLRDGRRRRRAGRSCTSTRPTACTARRATSWIRTRSSTGCRPKAGKARSTKACDALAPASDFEAAAIAALGTPLIEALGGTYRWRERGAEHLDARRARRPAADPRVLARPDPRRDALLPRSRHRRHHERELRRRVDRADHPAVRLRHGARIDVARRRARARAAAARHGRRPAGGVHRRRPARARARRAARRRLARERDRQSDRAVSHRGVELLDGRRAGTAIRCRSPAATSRSRSARRSTCRAEGRRSATIERARGVELERAATAPRSRAEAPRDMLERSSLLT